MTDQNYHIVETLIGVAQRLSSTPARVALAGQMAQPFVSAPIIGANSVYQLIDSMGAVELRLSEADLGRNLERGGSGTFPYRPGGLNVWWISRVLKCLGAVQTSAR